MKSGGGVKGRPAINDKTFKRKKVETLRKGQEKKCVSKVIF